MRTRSVGLAGVTRCVLVVWWARLGVEQARCRCEVALENFTDTADSAKLLTPIQWQAGRDASRSSPLDFQSPRVDPTTQKQFGEILNYVNFGLEANAFLKLYVRKEVGRGSGKGRGRRETKPKRKRKMKIDNL